jgi:hypothetical protein
MLGVRSGTTWAALQKLHAEKKVFISSWKRSIGTRGRMAPRWKLGDRRDAYMPKSDRNADSHRYYHKLEANIKKLRWMKYRGRLNVWSGLK